MAGMGGVPKSIPLPSGHFRLSLPGSVSVSLIRSRLVHVTG